MTASETPEAFRERVGRIADEVFHEEVNGAAGTVQEGGTLPASFSFTVHGFQCAAEAVYEQALRDMIDAMWMTDNDGTKLIRQAWAAWDFQKVIEFAASKGIEIDVEDTNGRTTGEVL